MGKFFMTFCGILLILIGILIPTDRADPGFPDYLRVFLAFLGIIVFISGLRKNHRFH